MCSLAVLNSPWWVSPVFFYYCYWGVANLQCCVKQFTCRYVYILWVYGRITLLCMHVCVYIYMYVCYSFSCVWLFVTPWTIALQVSLSMGILQARILKWVVIPFSKGSSRPRDRTQVSCIACGFFTVWATRKAQDKYWVCSQVPGTKAALKVLTQKHSSGLSTDWLHSLLYYKHRKYFLVT